MMPVLQNCIAVLNMPKKTVWIFQIEMQSSLLLKYQHPSFFPAYNLVRKRRKWPVPALFHASLLSLPPTVNVQKLKQQQPALLFNEAHRGGTLIPPPINTIVDFIKFHHLFYFSVLPFICTKFTQPSGNYCVKLI